MTQAVQWSAWRCSLALPSDIALKHHPVTQRQVLILRLRDAQGERWTEAAPLPGWSRDSLLDNEIALQRLVGLPLQDAATLPWPAALSTALGLLTIPADPHAEPQPSNDLLLSGQEVNKPLLTSPSLKMKVGLQSINEDIAHIQAVLDQLPKDSRLRLDANQSWDYAQVQQISEAFRSETRIDYIEEPLKPALSYQHWSQYSALAFAHDERLLEPEFTPSPFCSTLVLKPTLLGWPRTLALANWAKHHQKTVVLSSSFESPLALWRFNQLASHWQLTAIQGLATAHFFNNPLQHEGGFPLANVQHLEPLL